MNGKPSVYCLERSKILDIDKAFDFCVYLFLFLIIMSAQGAPCERADWCNTEKPVYQNAYSPHVLRTFPIVLKRRVCLVIVSFTVMTFTMIK